LPHSSVDVLKLLIAIRVAGSFQSLGIRLQTITQIVQHLGYHAMTGAVPHAL
jgi:hypothetical protein